MKTLPKDLLLKFSKTLGFPLETAIVQRYGFVGTVGSGKSSSAQVLAEEFLEHGVQIVVIDPTGTWWGLRGTREDSSKPSGLRIFIIGGKNGDVPIDLDKGIEYARWVVETGQSAIFDLKGARPGKRERFVETFMRELYRLKGEAKERTPLHVFLEESQRWAAQTPGDRDEKAVAYLMREIAEMIRNDGVGLSFITQAPQAVDKRVLNLTECLVVHQTNGKHERDAVIGWAVTKGLKIDPADLTTLDIGEAIVWSPRWLKVLVKVSVRLKRSFYAGSTLKFGERIRNVAPPLPAAELERLRDELEDTITRVEAEDPRVLRAEIARLKAELSRKPGPAPAAPVEPRVVERVVPSPDLFDALRKATSAQQDAAFAAQQADEKLWQVVDEIRGEFGRAATAASVAALKARPVHVGGSNHADTDGKAVRGGGAARPVAVPRPLGPGASMPPAARAILTALAQYPAGRTRKQAAILARYSPKSGGVADALATLRANGWIEGTASNLRATPAGLKALGEWEPLPTGSSLREYWLGKLKPAERAILEQLVKLWPRTGSREAVAKAAGYSPKSGGVADALARLRAFELIEGSASGLKASDDLFDGGE